MEKSNMDDTAFITGLHRQNSEMLGFIPDTTIESQYIRQGRYLLDRRNGRTGYLLHSNLHKGLLTIAQACIEYDFRRKGHGVDLVRRFLCRAEAAGAVAAQLRCRENMDQALAFWEHCGFRAEASMPGGKRRGQNIIILRKPLCSLFLPDEPGYEK